VIALALGVSQDAHRHARVNVERGQRGPAGTTGVVDADAAETGPSAAGIEAAVDGPWLDGPRGPCGEYQPVVCPGPDIALDLECP